VKNKVKRMFSIFLVVSLVFSMISAILADEADREPTDEKPTTETVEKDNTKKEDVEKEVSKTEEDTVFVVNEKEKVDDETEAEEIVDDSINQNENLSNPSVEDDEVINDETINDEVADDEVLQDVAEIFEGTLSGIVWLDSNDDGIYDAEETGIANYPVYLYLQGNSAKPIKTAYTDSRGRYEFAELEAGNYVLGVKPNELAVDCYLLPLVGFSQDNKFQIDTNTWSAAYSKPIQLDGQEKVSDINVGMRNPLSFVPLSTGSIRHADTGNQYESTRKHSFHLCFRE